MVIDYRPRRRHYEGRKVRGLTRPSYHYGNPGDVGSHAEYGPDLTQLNSKTSDLHLVVAPADER